MNRRPDPFRAYVQNQLDRCPQAEATNSVQRPALVTPGIRAERHVARGVVVITCDVCPSEFHRKDPILAFLAHVKNATAFRTQQPLVPVCCKSVDAGSPHIQWKCSQPLDGVDEEEATSTLADLADGVQIHAKSTHVLYKPDRQ